MHNESVLITGLVTRSFEGDLVNYVRDVGQHMYARPVLIGDAIARNETFNVETIKSKKFNINGVEYYLCWTPEIAEAIGIPMQCFDDMNRQKELLKSASLWQRLKWVFTGIK